MSTVPKVLKALQAKGSAQTVKTFVRHGASAERLYGVKIADMKVIAKTIKGNQALALDLFDSGNYDAMYLAGIVADGKQMTKAQLNKWAVAADWSLIAEYTVPWVASESDHGQALANTWIDSKKEHVAAAGWNTWAGLVTTVPDEQLELKAVAALLKRVEADIGGAKNRVKYCMNSFVIAVGAYVASLNKAAKATAKRLGAVQVDMGDTACKVPLALAYIEKIESLGKAGKKRKTIRC